MYINVNLLQYESPINLVVQDASNDFTMPKYLGNAPMYFDGRHKKLHKGIDNTLRFTIRDTDRRPVDLTGKSLIFKMYDRESRENVLFKFPEITNAAKGMARLIIHTVETVMLPQGLYNFACYTVDNTTEEEQIAYVDTINNAKGVIEVIDDVYPEFEPSQSNMAWWNDGNKYISTVFDGCGENIKSKSLHTFAFYFDNYKGKIQIQGDLSEQASSQDFDWFPISTNEVLYYSGAPQFDITINEETGVQGLVIKANVNWLRVLHWPDPTNTGEITKILMRN